MHRAVFHSLRKLPFQTASDLKSVPENKGQGANVPSAVKSTPTVPAEHDIALSSN